MLESHTDAAIVVLCGYFFPRFHLPELLFDLSYTEDTLIAVSLLSFVRSMATHFFCSFWFCCCVKERASSVKYINSSKLLEDCKAKWMLEWNRHYHKQWRKYGNCAQSQTQCSPRDKHSITLKYSLATLSGTTRYS